MLTVSLTGCTCFLGFRGDTGLFENDGQGAEIRKAALKQIQPHKGGQE